MQFNCVNCLFCLSSNVCNSAHVSIHIKFFNFFLFLCLYFLWKQRKILFQIDSLYFILLQYVCSIDFCFSFKKKLFLFYTFIILFTLDKWRRYIFYRYIYTKISLLFTGWGKKFTEQVFVYLISLLYWYWIHFVHTNNNNNKM